MIDRELYQVALRETARIRSSKVGGGQELILAEIIGCLKDCNLIWLPFTKNTTLLSALHVMGFATWHDSQSGNGELWRIYNEAEIPAGCDAVYFGTPTIVQDMPLFRDSITEPWMWTKTFERGIVRQIVGLAERANLKRIVCGLGSGDISLGERYFDVGTNAHAVAMKRFTDDQHSEFTDFVIVRDLRP